MTTKNSYLKEVFKTTPLTGFRRQPNLRNLLIKAKVPSNYNKRNIKGMFKCGRGCPTCPYIREGKSIKVNDKVWKINRKFYCNTFNVIYAITCKTEKCKETYIGETKRLLKSRVAEHCGYVRNQHLDKVTGLYFNLPGHSLADLTVTVFIFYKGLNRQKK